jgi:hypothetical protein
MILVVIIVAAILSVIVIETSLSSLTHLNISDSSLKGSAVEYYTDGCMQEALIRLDRDNSYGGGILMLGSGTCSVVVSGTGIDRTVTVSGYLNGYQYNLSADVVLSPFHIIKWDN